MLWRTPVIYIFKRALVDLKVSTDLIVLLVFLNDYRWCSYVRGISLTHGPFSTKLFSIATGLQTMFTWACWEKSLQSPSSHPEAQCCHDLDSPLHLYFFSLLLKPLTSLSSSFPGDNCFLLCWENTHPDVACWDPTLSECRVHPLSGHTPRVSLCPQICITHLPISWVILMRIKAYCKQLSY